MRAFLPAVEAHAQLVLVPPLRCLLRYVFLAYTGLCKA